MKLLNLFLALGLAVLAGCTPSTSALDDISQDRVYFDEVYAPTVVVGSDSHAGKSNLGCADLLAGQTERIGTVCYSMNDPLNTEITVTYNVNDPWIIDEAHGWLGKNLADMPQTKKGSPKIGLFPYGGSVAGTSFSFTAALADIGVGCATTMLAATHAAVRNTDPSAGGRTETGWGAGSLMVERGTWATYTSVFIDCTPDTPTPPTGGSETAFARSASNATCFLDLGIGISDRWGWTNGPLGEGTYVMDLIAGAGRCKNGTNVGTVTVVYSAGLVTVTYNLTGPYVLEQAHVYVGSDILATNNGEYTVAPGRYPIVDDDPASPSYKIAATGNVYVVAHASVSGF